MAEVNSPHSQRILQDSVQRRDSTSQQPAASLQKVRIAIVIGILDLGGSERQALALARYLREVAEADVQVFGCLEGGGRVIELCEQYDIPWRLIPLPWSAEWGRRKQIEELKRFTAALREAHVDVLMPYISVTDVFCGLVWRFTGAKTCIWSQRESFISAGVGPRRERWAVRLTPWFTSNSAHGAEYLVNRLHAPRARVSVIHNAIELPAPQCDAATWRSELKVGAQDFLAVMVANLHRLKDHETLVKAWRLVTDKVPATLLLAGRLEGTQNNLKMLAIDLGVSRYLRLLGPVKDVAGLLNACDLAVFSSPAEGSPNAVLESMAAGLAVSATDVPGIREAVGPDGLPFLAPVRDAETLAAKILALAENDALRKRLGEINRERIQTMFSVPRLGEATTRVISRALEAAG